MIKKLLFAGSLLALTPAFTQTSLFFEDFEGGAGAFTLNTTTQGGSGVGGINTYVVNNNYTGGSGTTTICFPGQPFSVGTTPAQPAGISSANGFNLHLLSDEGSAAGILNANYRPVDGAVCEFVAQSNFTEMTADVVTTGYTNVTFEFWWIHVGSASHTGEIWYSTNGGTTWTQKTGTNYHSQSAWTQQSLSDPAWDNQASLRFGFRFNNQVFLGGSDPCWSIDDVEILGCVNSSNSITETACFSYTVPSGDETYTTPGTMTVMDTIPNAIGCDSIITINLTINTVDVSVNTTMAGTLSANSATGTFQWIDCDDPGNVISGETNQVYTPASSGSYAVIITDNGCIDSSICNIAGPSGIHEYENAIEIYPNPSNGNISVDLSNSNGEQILTVSDVKGSIVFTKTVSGGSVQQLNINLETGIYYLSFYDENKNKSVAKLIIEK